MSDYTALINRLEKAYSLIEPLYIVIEDTPIFTYYVSDAIGDARVELLKLQQQEEMKEWNI